MSSNSTEGKARKDDKLKPDLSLIPYCAEVAMAEAFMVGLKYGRYNYCDGMEASREVAAIKRHIGKWFNGEERDPDGQHHLGSVMATCAMILRQQELGTLVDDRFKPKANPTTTHTEQEYQQSFSRAVSLVDALSASVCGEFQN